MALTECSGCGALMSAEPEARCPTCGGIALEKAPKSWKNSRWRQIMLIAIATNIPPFIYGCMLLAGAGSENGITALIADNYFSPILWITGSVFGGHWILFAGGLLLFFNSDRATETIKIGAGIIFVFQCLAVAMALAGWIGLLFKLGQGAVIDPETGDAIILSGLVLKELTINTFLTPRIFATTWLTISQMVILMVAIEKEKKEL